MMRNDFAVLILTHKRPDRQYTVGLLERSGYTGRWYLVVDDEDPTINDYKKRYGDRVIVFSKSEGRSITDDADNTGVGKGVVYARNMCWKIASSLGVKHFIQLDDDYSGFYLRFNSKLEYGSYRIKKTIDEIFTRFVEWRVSSGAAAVAMSQGGDHIGGIDAHRNGIIAKRKAMNTFICSTDKPFRFYGRINEDTTAYVTLGRRGVLFLTAMQAQVNQAQTQANAGGLTEIYLDSGTYYKSFLSVMWEPSCVKVSAMGDPRSGHYRIHHFVDWEKAVPCIIPERFKKENSKNPPLSPAKKSK